MEDNQGNLFIADYLQLIKNDASSFDQTINNIIIIIDCMKLKNVSDNNIMELIEALGYNNMLGMIDPMCADTIAESSTGHEPILCQTDKQLMSKLVINYFETDGCQSMDTICYISCLQLKNTWINDVFILENILIFLTKELAYKVKKDSFEKCEQLAYIIPSIPGNKLHDTAAKPWQKYLHKGLCNMILSKLPIAHRHKSLKLASAVFDCFAMDWILGEDRGSDLFVVAVNQAYIEIRLCLENKSVKDVVTSYVDLKAWFTIVDIASQHLICETTTLTDAQVVQLNGTLQYVADVLIKFVRGNMPIYAIPRTISELFTLLIIKTICSLIADENRSTSENIIDILPFLIKNINSQIVEHKNDEPLHFIIPSLVLLTIEEKCRQVLLQLNIEELLYNYIVNQWGKAVDNGTLDESILEYNTRKIPVAFNILLNIVAYEFNRIRTTHIYGKLSTFILSTTPVIPIKGQFLNLTGVFCTFGTLILSKVYTRYTVGDEEVFSFLFHTVTFLWQAFTVSDHKLSVSKSYEPYWDDVQDPWLLTMHNLYELINTVGWIAQYCIDCEWVSCFVGNFMHASVKSVEISTKTSYEEIFVAIYNYDPSSVNSNELKTVAKKHNMTKLLAVLA